MSWLYLLLGGLLEVVWAFGLKLSNGFTELFPSIVTIIALGFSFFFFSKSMKSIAIGTAYAVFTGIGAVGTVIIGMIFLNESAQFSKIASIILLVVGIIGLKITSTDEVRKNDSEETKSHNKLKHQEG